MEYFTDEYRKNTERDFYVQQKVLGATTSPQSANQIQEVISRLNSGVKHIELELISPDLFDSVPKQHFEEMRRMAKLTGANVNIHAPVQNMDLAGFKEGGWSETEREKVEQSMKHMIDRGADLGNNTVVNFHSSGGVPAYEWQAEKSLGEEELPPEGKRKVFVIDQADPRHQIMPLEYEEKQYFGGTQILSPEKRREMVNRSSWDQEKLQLFNYEKEKAELNDRLYSVMNQLEHLQEGNKKGILNDNEKKILNNYENSTKVIIGHIQELNTHMDTQLEDLHDKFNRFTSDKQKEQFLKSKNEEGNENKEEYYRLVNSSKKEMEFHKKQREIFEKANLDPEKARLELEKVQKNFFGRKTEEDIQEEEKNKRERLLNIIQKMPTPERFVSTDKFAKEKLSETVANSAFYAYDKFKEKAPVIAIENVFPDWTLGRAESLKEAVIESREKFAKELHEKKNISKDKAKEISEKLIGATWDVGHITQLRKFGYKEKDIIEEAKKIAPVVKHIHVTDNFGFSDSHLAPGQGTVSINEQLKKLKEGLGNEYDKVAHIIESGGFASQFKQSPRIYELQHFNSPLYEMRGEPFWNEIAYTSAEYNQGYGMMFPEKHFEMYGSGFSNLPQELGGQVSGDKSKFSGTPND